MTDLLQASSLRSEPIASPGALQQQRHPRAKTTAVAWLAHAQLSLAEWEIYGTRIGLMSKSTNWWLGDWVRFGQRRYDLHYKEASEISGYDEQTLMNLAYVAGRFSTSRRRETLSWSHHAELAKLEQDDQEIWLDRATAAHLSVRKLRGELRDAERRMHPADLRTVSPPAAVPLGTLVICQHCHQAFPLVAETLPDGQLAFGIPHEDRTGSLAAS